jgi:hypothetical protein
MSSLNPFSGLAAAPVAAPRPPAGKALLAWLAKYCALLALGDPALAPAAHGQVLTDQLVVHLRFDGTVHDTSGRNNHGMAMNVGSGTTTYAAGRIGQAVRIRGGTTNYNYVSLAGSDVNFGTNVDFSVSFWARFATIPDTGEDNDPVFLSNKDWESGNNVGWVIATGPDGRLQWNYRAEGQDRRDYNGPAGTMNNNNWNHVAVTFARAGNIVTYLNGTQVNSQSAGPLASIDAGLRTNIGNDGQGNYTLGLWDELFVDDVAIWRRVVTPAEVSTIYTAGQRGESAIPEPSAVALAGLGLAALLGAGWRRSRRKPLN